MHKKLALLCEQQLKSILLEADMAFKDIISAATTSVHLMDAMTSDARSDHNPAGAPDGDLCKAVKTEMQRLMIKMQFHDEFSQRLHHVSELCQLIAEHDAGMSGAEQVESALLGRVRDIFSVSSEFTVLQTIFPEYQHERPDLSVELF